MLGKARKVYLAFMSKRRRVFAIKSGHTRRSLAKILSTPVALDTLKLDKKEKTDLTNNLVGVFGRFRKEPVAAKCDIESMFCQVRVSEQHRDRLRFLWWKHGEFSGELEEFRMAVHLSSAVSSPACANFALKRTAHDNEADLRLKPVFHLANLFARTEKKVGTVPTCS